MSQDRIEFYEQVLELEPGSKLFYTLARLYYDRGDLKKAQKVLESGLEKHPEHMQARLLLASVMERSGDLSAAQGVYREIFDKVFNHPEFWSGLASAFRKEGRHEPALAASFLSSWISDHTLTWSRVFQNGLDSLKKNHAPESSPDKLGPAQPEPEQEDSGPEPDTGPGYETSQDFSLEPLDSQDSQIFGDEAAHEAPLEGMDTVEEDTQPESSHEDFPGLSGPQKAHEEEPGAVEHEMEHASTPAREDAPLGEEDSQHEELQEIEPDNLAGEEEFDEPEEVEDIKFEDDARTRSMADLLAAQEEYQKALDIYNELWVRSLPGPERLELESIISGLKQTLGLDHDSRDQSPETAEREEPSALNTDPAARQPDNTDEIDPKQFLEDRETNFLETYPEDAGEKEKSTDREAPDKEEVMSFLSRLADRLDKK